MVLLKLETGPGWGQFKTNYLRREITREVRKRRPQWIAGSAECHKTEPASASFALSANWKSYPESDWHWATPVAFCSDPGRALRHQSYLSGGYRILECGHLKSILEPTVPGWRFSYTDSRTRFRFHYSGDASHLLISCQHQSLRCNGCWDSPWEHSGKALYRKSDLPHFLPLVLESMSAPLKTSWHPWRNCRGRSIEKGHTRNTKIRLQNSCPS